VHPRGRAAADAYRPQTASAFAADVAALFRPGGGQLLSAALVALVAVVVVAVANIVATVVELRRGAGHLGIAVPVSSSGPTIEYSR